MRADNFDPEDLVTALQGTAGNSIDSCLGPDGILNDDFTPKYPNMDEDDLLSSDYDYIDNFIFLCPDCGWWCEVGDWNQSPDSHEDICGDCFREQYPEEDEE